MRKINIAQENLVLKKRIRELELLCYAKDSQFEYVKNLNIQFRDTIENLQIELYKITHA